MDRQPPRTKSNRKWLLWAAAVGIGLLCFTAIWLLEQALLRAQYYPLLQLQNNVYDRGMTLYAQSAGHRRLPVAVLRITDVTRRKLSEPRPSFASGIDRPLTYRRDSRLFHAQVVRNLKRLGAAVIVFDMVFGEPDAEADPHLAKAIREHGKVVLAASDQAEFANDGQAEILHALLPPVPDLREAAASYGVANLPPDPDRTLRRFPWWTPGWDEDTLEPIHIPSLAVCAAAVYSGLDPRKTISEDVEREGRFLDKRIVGFRHRSPITKEIDYFSFIRFFGGAGSPAGPRSTANYEDVFLLGQDPAVDEADLRERLGGKIVLIGDVTATGQDVHRSPVWTAGVVNSTNELPGVEIQAAVVQTALSGLYVRQASPLAHGLLLLGACLFMAAVTRLFTPLPAVGVGLFAVLGLFFGSVWLVSARGYWMEPVTASAGVILSTMAGTAVMYAAEHRERMVTRRLLDRHLGPGVAGRLSDDEFPELGGESVEITLLFSDLQGFTSLSEKMDSPQICELLNRYFGEVIFPILFKHGGTLDKLMGDGMMAYFGWVPRHPDHARRAVLCALEMERALAEWLKQPENAELPPLRTRIGIHTGVATVGEIGSGQRTEFTVIGDVVNVSARLEAMNKEFGSVILMTEATRKGAGEVDVLMKERGAVPVRGRAEPIPVFSIDLEDIVGTGSSKEQGGSEPAKNDEPATVGETGPR